MVSNYDDCIPERDGKLCPYFEVANTDWGTLNSCSLPDGEVCYWHREENNKSLEK